MQRTKQFGNAIATSQVFERRTAHILFGVIIVAFGLYLYGMLSTVSFALARRSTEVAIREAVSETAALEGTYLALSEGLTIDVGTTLGLTTPKAIAYAHEGAASTAVALAR